MKTISLTEDQYLRLIFLLNDAIHENNSEMNLKHETDYLALLAEENAAYQSILEELQN